MGGSAMWRGALLLGILIASPITGWCDTVQFTIDPANTGIVFAGGTSFPVSLNSDLTSSALNGTVLAGQSLSLDLVLSNEMLARLIANDTEVGVTLAVYTNAPYSFTEFAGPSSTGFLLDPEGNQLGPTEILGRAGGNNGAMFVGVEGPSPPGADISGAQFDITLPNTGYVITGIDLGFEAVTPYDSVEFGTAQQLLEPSSLLLLGSGLLGLVVLFRRKF